MIVVHCATCHKRRLLDLGSLTSLDNTGDGFRVGYRCACGSSGSMVMTGSRTADSGSAL